jgi:hypothetical protein
MSIGARRSIAPFRVPGILSLTVPRRTGFPTLPHLNCPIIGIERVFYQAGLRGLPAAFPKEKIDETAASNPSRRAVQVRQEWGNCARS